jgi:hypothetical protein|tara:strand:+ start:420 stop:740 length:321 start_codon:yes stop_codon:yes gene_type:complete
MKFNFKYLSPFLLLLAILFTSGCVSSERVAGKRYSFLSIPGSESAGIYTYEKDYSSVSLIQKPADYIFFNARNPDVGFGDSALGNVKTVDGSRHQFLWGLISFQNP